jgi:hypothetical protein
VDEQETLGYLRGKVETLEGQLRQLMIDVSGIRSYMDKQKGGWKTLSALLIAAASLGAAVSAAVEWISHK